MVVKSCILCIFVCILISWIFDGLGTEIISLIVGLISGGAIGYKIGIHNRIKQSQKAGNNSRQTQISSINYGVNK